MLYYAIGLFVQYFSKSFGVNLQTFRCNSNLESNPRYDTSTYKIQMTMTMTMTMGRGGSGKCEAFIEGV